MRSTFQSLETAKRGMAMQQTALQTLGHNITNANTPGFSRQRVNFQTTTAFPKPGMQAPFLPGQVGTGGEAGSVQRIRDNFLDLQFRKEVNKLGFYGAKTDALKKMEDIMNEPSEDGLSKQLNNFWKSLQDLAVNPQNSGARSVVLERGKAVTETFHYLSNSLKDVQKDLNNQISVTTKEVNSLIEQISNVNKQIADVEPHGYLPNDLYDERDRLVDQLSGLVNVKVSYVESGGMAKPEAEGRASIELLDANGSPMGLLVDGLDLNTKPNYLTVNYESRPLGEASYVTGITVGPNTIPMKDFASTGKLKGLIDSYGYVENGTPRTIKGEYPEMLQQLDQLAGSFVIAFNEAHKQGWTLDGDTGKDFFDPTKLTADSISLAIKSPTEIASAGQPTTSGGTENKGNGDNALKLAEILRGKITIYGDPATKSNPKEDTMDSFYQGMIGTMGVRAQESERLMNNSNLLAANVEDRRMQVSSVSLDEEMINMVKYQHAYNAAARNITLVDEMLDKIINGMGLVGR
ncbi:flagellar hook-associated protein FlgK [Priestia taiwanensis]|uniref:Flagellar hook-associated protein 1 n=1 Tax=Priestia taiwanensis TaxID=1347902 RepID=A0A917AXW8_9BACI|nr:flagellar hook-associated protein FlgK [Priestia taiwanensis]MBM7364377.1 flagellar hook-associated protein 1 FlgK [Priestia taiwanensis]GGE84929.1 flagellar hook-associated protein 1 [Priestia taiwanensis]